MMSKRISLKIKTSRCIITGCNSCERVYVRASTVFEGPDFPSVFRAKQDDTFILSSCNNGRDSGSQFNLSNILDESTSREKCTHALQSSVARSDLQREMHLARISAPPTIDILEGQTCANRCTRQKWGIMRSANARDSGSRCCVLCAYYATRMQ